MKFRIILASAFLVLASSVMTGQINGDVLGVHNLSSPVNTPAKGVGSLNCVFCHAPHGGIGGSTPLWNHTLSTQTYVPYSSTTYQNVGNPTPTLGSDSSLCLSCHDGTVALGSTTVYGTVPTGSMNSGDILGPDVKSSHPFSLNLPIKDSSNLAASIVASKKTTDVLGKVNLINGNVECTSCHNPHVQSTDKIAQNFLAKDSSYGQLCLACHDPSRTTTGKTNTLAGWAAGIHATSTNATPIAANVGMYGTVASNACLSCHQSHNAPGSPGILRAPTPAIVGLDPVTQDCLTCHNANANVSAPNVYAEFSKAGIGSGALMGSAHLLPDGLNAHDATESAQLTNNRHATCVDCHNPHSSQQVSSFSNPPSIRTSQATAQAGVVGISATDGTTILNPAVNQYENCLRCHGTNAGRAKNASALYGDLPLRVVSGTDPWNLIPEFASVTSSHPVTHPRSSVLPQPSLLPTMLKLDGTTASARQMGANSYIFCTDCHNSDDNREFSVSGGGPNGPHGSRFSHLLERRYEIEQAPAAGAVIPTLFKNPNLSASAQDPGPYALCGKCHDLNNVLSDKSFTQHSRHVRENGFSCSICHTSHGMGATSATISGERLVNFDASVVAPNGGLPISYNRSSNSCTLSCHNYAHNPNGTVTPAASIVKVAAK